MRDINIESTIYARFTTRAFATGIPTTLGGTPVLSVYEENNLTQITAGVSVTADYDTVTGLNQATIVATAANGYEAGKSYDLVITTGTVGGVSVVGEVVYSFTVEDAAVIADVATAQADLDTITGSDGVTLASMQGNSITFQPIEITAGDAINNITLSGTGSSDGLAFTRSGAGDPFDSNFMAQINAEVDTALTDYDAATGAELAATEAKIDIIDTNVDSVLVDTAEIGTAGAGLTDLGGMSTGMKAEVLAEVVKLLVTQMTESYAADGTAPTPAQALMLIQQALTEFAFSGTSNTVKKLDGSTTAAVMTLDDATNPTSSTRSS